MNFSNIKSRTISEIEQVLSTEQYAGIFKNQKKMLLSKIQSQVTEVLYKIFL